MLVACTRDKCYNGKCKWESCARWPSHLTRLSCLATFWPRITTTKRHTKAKLSKRTSEFQLLFLMVSRLVVHAGDCHCTKICAQDSDIICLAKNFKTEKLYLLYSDCCCQVLQVYCFQSSYLCVLVCQYLICIFVRTFLYTVYFIVLLFIIKMLRYWTRESQPKSQY